ncbi:MAG TPA: carboxypeptidase-like regulatory domain-containing protein, partial [Pyrinomonadaceae bacterium]|nr:carboxypeptidase-like regulatory domain-containing protein [Pyrinomonadaceae bacterium]
MTKFRTLLTLVICFGLFSAIFAQAVNGRIEGTVKDASGAVVPGAIVLVRNNQTNLERTATTGDEGSFAIAELAPGDYSVKIEAANFRVT